MTSTTAPLRLERSLAVSAIGLATAIGGHVAAGGDAPGPWGLAVASSVGLALAWLSCGVRLTWGPVLGLVLVFQGVLHLACAGESAAGMAPVGPGMLLGHGLATSAVVVTVLRGERWVWGLARLLAAPLSAVVPRLPRDPIALPHLSVVHTADDFVPTTAWVPRQRPVRGPPVLA